MIIRRRYSVKLFEDISLRNGKIIFHNFDIDPAIPFEKQKWSFKEDLIQITFGENYLVDVGWYPEADKNGCFVIEMIRNFDWENPLFEKQCKSYQGLKQCIQEAINMANSFSKNIKSRIV